MAETTNEDAQHQGEQQQSAASAAVVVGYLVSYPSRLDDPPVLSNDEWCVPHPADAYFIHEVTVDPRRQGLGVGRLLCAKAIECARRFGEIHQSGEGGEGRRSVRFVALISVQGSSQFWHRHGGFLPYDFVSNRLHSRFSSSVAEEEGPSLFDEPTAKRLMAKLAHSYGPDALMMLAPMP